MRIVFRFKRKKFVEVANEYIESRKNDLRATSYASYLHLLQKRIIPKIGEIEICKFSNEDLQQFVNSSIQSGYSKHGTRDCASLIKLVVKYAVKQKYCDDIILSATYPRKKDKAKSLFFSESDYRRLLTYCIKNPGKKTFPTLIAMTTGARIGEVCALRWGDIDFKERTITIERSIKRISIYGEKSFIEISAPKTTSSIRTVPLVPDVAQMLKKFKESDDVYISSGNNILPLEPRSYRQKYSRMLKTLGIPQHTFHDLRHTFASRCINAGADARTVADILGHTNVEMTLNTYTHSTDERRKEVVKSAWGM